MEAFLLEFMSVVVNENLLMLVVDIWQIKPCVFITVVGNLTLSALGDLIQGEFVQNAHCLIWQ
jgi:hypothetical protein